MVEQAFPGGTTVLVAEDEALVRMFTADYLREAGYRVVEVSNAAETLNELENTTGVRVLLTDVEMPGGMDGMELHARCSGAGLAWLSSSPRAGFVRREMNSRGT